MTVSTFETLMAHPLIFDGRNCFFCFALKEVEKSAVAYYSVGRRL
ncbi:hypothetical protein [Salipaludibacillus sp. LMS25]|jgi:hypothetical protein|nr:hypothetical protein [Salipaludibacillus sp. LMS25]